MTDDPEHSRKTPATWSRAFEDSMNHRCHAWLGLGFGAACLPVVSTVSALTTTPTTILLEHAAATTTGFAATAVETAATTTAAAAAAIA
ncbi:MAG: hypothetical protein P8J59_01965, partial [Phycisphaerales bacterium]|nr:hypothetical protein [Phycisphaerales bacterium]